MVNATDINRAYGRLTAGRENYWKLMPAPHMRSERVVAAIRSSQPNVRELCDFGCGNGDVLAVLARHFPLARLYGIDLSAEQIRGFPFHDSVEVGRELASHRDDPPLRRAGVPFPECATAAVLRLLFRFNSRPRGNQLVAQRK